MQNKKHEPKVALAARQPPISALVYPVGMQRR